MKFVEYVERDSFIHRLDVRSKLAMGLAIVSAAFILNHPAFMVMLFLSVLALSTLAKILREFVKQTRILFSVVVMAFILWSLFYRWSLFAAAKPSKVIFKIGFITLDELGLLYGVSMPFRVLVLIGTPLLILMTTPLSDIMLALTKLKVPYKVAFTLGLSLRYVPTIIEEMSTIREAQMSRGLELERGGLINRIKAHIPLLKPLMIRAIEFADRMSLAIETRAFGAFKKRSSYREIRMNKFDLMVVAISIIILISCITLRLMGVGVIA